MRFEARLRTVCVRAPWRWVEAGDKEYRQWLLESKAITFRGGAMSAAPWSVVGRCYQAVEDPIA